MIKKDLLQYFAATGPWGQACFFSKTFDHTYMRSERNMMGRRREKPLALTPAEIHQAFFDCYSTPI